MLASTQRAASPLISSGSLEVRLAENFQEVDEAMRLRFEVFNLELNEGLLSSWDRGYDSDPYDAWCDHLVVRDLELGRIVGTYRLLRQSVAEQQIGFYSENEFDLSRLRRSARLKGLELLELGRSCIASTHRTFATINLLWGAIAQYSFLNQIDLLFGCGSLHVSEPAEVQPIYNYLRDNHLAPEKYRVEPVPGCRMTFDDTLDSAEDPRVVQRRLSPILRGYLRTGAMVCGEPALDREFGTADVLVLLEMSQLAGRYRQHYGIEE
ncbi:MAG: GNAT family N-acetyltransferase [Acidobacteria bacterium]|nr:GNAT family N-acetyltransferase [Acidobacteriota bacterium]